MSGEGHMDGCGDGCGEGSAGRVGGGGTGRGAGCGEGCREGCKGAGTGAKKDAMREWEGYNMCSMYVVCVAWMCGMYVVCAAWMYDIVCWWSDISFVCLWHLAVCYCTHFWSIFPNTMYVWHSAPAWIFQALQLLQLMLRRRSLWTIQQNDEKEFMPAASPRRQQHQQQQHHPLQKHQPWQQGQRQHQHQWQQQQQQQQQQQGQHQHQQQQGLRKRWLHQRVWRWPISRSTLGVFIRFGRRCLQSPPPLLLLIPSSPPPLPQQCPTVHCKSKTPSKRPRDGRCICAAQMRWHVTGEPEIWYPRDIHCIYCFRSRVFVFCSHANAVAAAAVPAANDASSVPRLLQLWLLRLLWKLPGQLDKYDADAFSAGCTTYVNVVVVAAAAANVVVIIAVAFAAPAAAAAAAATANRKMLWTLALMRRRQFILRMLRRV